MDHSDSIFSYLQDDLIIEILSRLPVKSLIRCSCVCKFWKTLIRSDHDFIKSHLRQSLSDNRNSTNKVLIYSEPEFRESHALDLHLNPKMQNLFLGPHFVFVGCCNGILCYYSKYFTTSRNQVNVHLWNPATHEFRTLPEGSFRSRSCKQVFVFFVYDTVNDDYKVVKFHYRSNSSNPYLEGEVYRLRTNAWKMINLRSFPAKLVSRSNIFAHNGALHCINVSTRGRRAVLSVFDVDEERFAEVLLPDCNYRIKPMPRLGSFKEFLSWSIWRENFEVWVMKEYGVWTKKCVLVNTTEIHSPYGMTANGKILAVNWDGEDVLYDVEGQKVEQFVQNKVVFIKANTNYSDTDHVVVAEYVESLISPFPPAETRETTNVIAPIHTLMLE